MNFSNFKKCGSDSKITTLRHKDGHELRILHGSLSEGLKKQLDKLPMAEGGAVHESVHPKQGMSQAGLDVRSGTQDGKLTAYGKSEAVDKHKKVLSALKAQPTPKLLAEGGDTEDGLETPPTQSLGEPRLKMAEAGKVPDTSTLADSVGAQVSSAMNGNPMAGVQDYTPTDAQTAGQDASATAAQLSPNEGGALAGIAQQQGQEGGGDAISPEEVAPAAEASPVSPVEPEVPPQQKALNEFQHEDAAVQGDLQNGTISPQTYQTIFNDKSTLGKIGTLAGLLISGFGSGLAHQQNAVLKGMDDQLNRDLEAQKQNQANKQSVYHLNLQHELQKAQIGQMPSEINLRNQQAASTRADALTKMQMLRTTQHFLNGLVNTMPPGQQQRAVPAMQGVHAAAEQHVGELAQKYAAAAPEVGGSSHILSPNAAASVTGAQFGHLPDADAMAKDYDTARQAEKGMAVVDTVFPKLGKEANFGEYMQGLLPSLAGSAKGAVGALGAERLLNPAAATAPGSAALLAAGLGGAALAGGAALSNLQQTRLYNTNKTLLRGAITSALRGVPGVTGDSVNETVDSFTPEWGDSPEVLETKARAIKEYIHSHANPNTLHRYGLAD